jgi:hypothetical protein
MGTTGDPGVSDYAFSIAPETAEEGQTEPLAVPDMRNDTWAMDFMANQLASSHGLRANHCRAVNDP